MDIKKGTKLIVYDAEVGHNITLCFYPDDYVNDEEMKAQMDKVKDSYKEFNRLFKLKRRKQRIGNAQIIEYDPADVEKVKVFKPKVHRPTLKLDSGTGNTTVIMASSKSGKSYLMMELIKKYYYNPRKTISVLFSTNPQIAHYKKCDERLLRYTGFDEYAEKIIKTAHYINRKCDNKYSFMFAFDDILSAKNNRIFNDMILTYRNSNISSITCLQYPYMLSKQNRSNVNNVLLGYFLTDECITEVIKIFLTGFFKSMGLSRISDMIMKYRMITENHHFILINIGKNEIRVIKA